MNRSGSAIPIVSDAAEVGVAAGLEQDHVVGVGRLDRTDQAVAQSGGVAGRARARLVDRTAVVALELGVQRLVVEKSLGSLIDLVADHVGVAAVVLGDRRPHPGELPLQVGTHVVGPEVVHARLDGRRQVRRRPSRSARTNGRPSVQVAHGGAPSPFHGVSAERVVRTPTPRRPGACRCTTRMPAWASSVDDPVGPRQVRAHGGRVVGIGRAQRRERVPAGGARSSGDRWARRRAGPGSSPSQMIPSRTCRSRAAPGCARRRR